MPSVVLTLRFMARVRECARTYVDSTHRRCVCSETYHPTVPRAKSISVSSREYMWGLARREKEGGLPSKFFIGESRRYCSVTFPRARYTRLGVLKVFRWLQRLAKHKVHFLPLFLPFLYLSLDVCIILKIA